MRLMINGSANLQGPISEYERGFSTSPTPRSHMSSRHWIVSQIGAREHYAIPRALHDRDRLRQLFTDAWCGWGHSLLRHFSDPIRSLANRYHPDLPRPAVTAYTLDALAHRIRSFFNSVEPGSPAYYAHHRRIGARFARKVRRTLEAREANFDQSVFFGYNTACLETLEYLEATQCLTIVDQIDPGRVHKKIVQNEAERWPGWSRQVPVIDERFESRLEAEWEKATVVVVNSDWSKKGLIDQGVPQEKIEVVPLAYDSLVNPSALNRHRDDESVHVLWLGTVNLAKGIQYLLEAARSLAEAPIRFSIVGPIEITEKAITSAPSNVNFMGQVPRDKTTSWYRSADVFVLPTLSDGFAITQLEAMAHGLPVVVTPNCGKVVTDGEDGFQVPPRDAEALVEVFTSILEDPACITYMGRKALETAQTFTLDRVADRLLEIVGDRDTG